MEIVTKYGYIVGIFVSRIPDSDDPDRYPDVISASIVPTITRVVNTENLPLVSSSHGASGVFMKTVEFPCALMSDGHLTGDIASPGVASPTAVPGMWLPIGLYKISLLGHAPDIEFLVEERHTQESPLDLYQYAKFVSDPSAPIQVVEIPSGGESNQVLAWTPQGLSWYDAPANSLSLGSVTQTGEDTAPSVTISGTPPLQTIDFTFPAPKQGAPAEVKTVTRSIASAMYSHWRPGGDGLIIYRTGSIVSLAGSIYPTFVANRNNPAMVDIPEGFRPLNQYMPVIANEDNNGLGPRFITITGSSYTLTAEQMSDGYTINAVWVTNDAWPTILPGTAV